MIGFKSTDLNGDYVLFVELKWKYAWLPHNTATHFWHRRNINCLAITKNRVRYEQLAPSEYDDEQALNLLAQVRHNLYEVYLIFQALTDVGKWQEFKEALNLTDKMNIWRYKGLTLVFVPYILVTFVD